MRNSVQTIYTIKELILAIQENRDIAEIRQIISGIEDINQANIYGSTALHDLAFVGHLEIVAQLLAYVADVNQAGANGWTALHWAVEKGHLKIVAQLLAAGADVNKANKDGETALYWAAYIGHLEIVAQLLAAGADVNKANKYGWTALYWAAQKGHVEIVAQLLAVGADETLLNEADQVQYAEAIAEGRAILIRNTRNSAIALADIGRELQRVSIIQNHPSREQAESKADINKLPGLTEPILAQIAAFATVIQRPNSLTQEQIEQCANVGTECIEGTDMLGFFHYETKFVERDPGNTIQNILNGNQNPANGQGLGG
jgi:ankyrin repeat protein